MHHQIEVHGQESPQGYGQQHHVEGVESGERQGSQLRPPSGYPKHQITKDR